MRKQIEQDALNAQKAAIARKQQFEQEKLLR